MPAHCDPRWNPGCIQKPYCHSTCGTCGCHGNHNTQRLQRSLVSLNGCKEWQNTRGRLAWRMFDQVLIYSARLLLRRIFLMETNCSEQGCCVFLPKSLSLSRTLPGLSLPPNAATLDKFIKKQMAATGFLHTVFSLYTAFGWNLGPCVIVKPRPFVYACQ